MSKLNVCSDQKILYPKKYNQNSRIHKEVHVNLENDIPKILSFPIFYLEIYA